MQPDVVEGVGHQGVDPLGRLLDRRQRGGQTGGEPGFVVARHRVEEVVPAREVPIQRAARDPGGLTDLLHAESLHPAPAHQAEGRAENPFLGGAVDRPGRGNPHRGAGDRVKGDGHLQQIRHLSYGLSHRALSSQRWLGIAEAPGSGSGTSSCRPVAGVSPLLVPPGAHSGYRVP